MSAQIIQFPRKAEDPILEAVDSFVSTRKHRERIQQLILMVGRDNSSLYRGASCPSTVQVRNYLIVRYHVHSVAEIPSECLPEAIALLEEMHAAVMTLEREWRELKKQFEQECLGAGVAWVPWIKRKMRSLKEELPERPDWSALATRVGVARRDEP